MLEKCSNNSSNSIKHSNSIKRSNKKIKALPKDEKRTRTSFICKHFKEDVDEEGIPVIICQVKNDGIKCDTKYIFTGSTGNANIHLRNSHEICNSGKIK
ncbi:10560_t:CDS:1, partial [Dentiscutata heterogama]